VFFEDEQSKLSKVKGMRCEAEISSTVPKRDIVNLHIERLYWILAPLDEKLAEGSMMNLIEVAQTYTDLVKVERKLISGEARAKHSLSALRAKYHRLLMAKMREEGVTFSNRADAANKAFSILKRRSKEGLLIDDKLCRQYETIRHANLYTKALFFRDDKSNSGIRVYLCWGPGNQLFRYCLGRILALKTKLSFQCISSSKWLTQPRGLTSIAELFNLPFKIKGREVSGIQQHLFEQTINIDKVKRNRPILIDGYFENYKYYRPYKKEIRQWLGIERLNLPAQDPECLCVNARLGQDMGRLNRSMKAGYYEKAIESIGWKSIHLVTDNPQHEIAKRIRRRYKAVVISNNFRDDFFRVMSYNKIVISDSTFCWWAAWLSNAAEIVSSGPHLDNRKYGGFWASAYKLPPKSLQRIDLYVNDEKRYRFING
jgi:hypothetical protein